MWRRFKKGAANDSRTGLSIDNSRVAFATAQTGQADSIRLTASVFDESAQNSKRAQQLASRMSSVSSKSPVTSVLPESSYEVLLIEVPNVPDSEVNDAARWIIKDQIDMPVDEMIVEMFKLPKQSTADGKAMGYAVVARRSSIKQHIELVKGSGLSLNVIDIPEMCTRNIATLLPQDQYGVAFLHFTQTHGILTVTRKGVLYLLRRIEKGRSAIDAASTGEFATADLDHTSELDILRAPDEVDPLAGDFSRAGLVHNIVQEIQRSLDFYDTHYNCEPLNELVLSPGSNVGGLAKSLNENLGLAVSSLNLNRLFEMKTELSSQEQSACMLAIGAALRSEAQAA